MTIPAPPPTEPVVEDSQFNKNWYHYLCQFQTLPQSFINVKRDYGAVGDGVTDDTAAINNAFTALSTSERTLYFPAGTYLVSTIVIPDVGSGAENQTRIFGDGGKSIIRQATASKALNILEIGTSPLTVNKFTADIIIDGLAFECQSAKTAGAAIYGYRPDRLILNNIFMLDGKMWDGIELNGVDNVIINRVVMVSVLRDGIRASAANTSASPGAELVIGPDVDINTPTRYGVLIGGGMGGVYMSGYVQSAGSTGFVCDKSISGVTNRELTFTPHCALDICTTYNLLIDASSCEVCQITGGTYNGGATASIYVADQGTPSAPADPMFWCAITGAHMTSGTGTGIALNGHGRFTIEGCTIGNFTGDGIDLNLTAGGTNARAIIVGNHIERCTGWGIQAFTVPAGLIVTNNSITGNTAGQTTGIAASATVLLQDNIA